MRSTERLLRGRIIAFNSAVANACDSALAGLLLSQAIWESNRHDGEWFAKGREEWKADTAMTRCEQETARRDLIKLGFLEEKKEGNPYRLMYRVNMDAIVAALDTASTNLLAGNQPTGVLVSRQPYARDINRLTESGLTNRDKEGDIVDAYASTCLTDTAVNNSSLTRNQESSRTRENGTALPKRPRASTALPVDTAPAPKNASALYIDAYREATVDFENPQGITPTLGPRHHKQLKDCMTTCGGPEGFSRALQGFFGDQWARGANFTVSALCSRQPDGWWGTVQQKSNGPKSDEDLMAITEKALQQKWPWEK